MKTLPGLSGWNVHCHLFCAHDPQKFLPPDAYQLLDRWPYLGALHDLRDLQILSRLKCLPPAPTLQLAMLTCFLSRGWSKWKWVDGTYEQKKASNPFISSFLHSLIHLSLIHLFYEVARYLHSDMPQSRHWDPIVNKTQTWTLTFALHSPITWAMFLHSMFLLQDICTCYFLCLKYSSPNYL